MVVNEPKVANKVGYHNSEIEPGTKKFAIAVDDDGCLDREVDCSGELHPLRHRVQEWTC